MIYLDNAATTKPLNSFIANSNNFLENYWYNPNSIYKCAVDVRNIINKTRELAVGSLNNKFDCIFTSCGTEGAYLAITGNLPLDLKGKKIISSMVEHPCVYNLVVELKKRGANVVYVKNDKYGVIDFEDFKEKVDRNTILISVMHVNNITGGVNDINMLYDYAKAKNNNIIFHSDGVQGYLKTKVIPKCDLYSVSGHKINALKGIGMLFVKKGFKFNGKLPGGGQENGIRSGTENTLGIYSLNYAIDFWSNNLDKNIKHMEIIKNRAIYNLSQIDDTVINSSEKGSSHIINASFLGVGGEIMLHSLEGEGIMVSTGSACSSRKKDPRISNALGMSSKVASSQLRMSFTYDTNINDVDIACEKINEICKEHRKLMRRR